MSICERKCLKASDESSLSQYEKACLGKCFDKYYGVYEKNLSSIAGAMKQRQSASEYEENL